MDSRLVALISAAEAAGAINSASCDHSLRWWRGLWLRLDAYERSLSAMMASATLLSGSALMANPALTESSRDTLAGSVDRARLTLVKALTPWIDVAQDEAAQHDALIAEYLLLTRPELLNDG